MKTSLFLNNFKKLYAEELLNMLERNITRDSSLCLEFGNKKYKKEKKNITKLLRLFTVFGHTGECHAQKGV